MTNLSSLSFNTVQGWNLDSGFSYRKWNDENGKYTSITVHAMMMNVDEIFEKYDEAAKIEGIISL